jgi:NAD+ synthetase
VTAFSSGAPIVLLCLARPELLERRPEWAVPGPDRIGFPLEPLSEDEARAMMVTLEPELDEEAFEQIVERADGNPLFLEQLVAAVRDGAEPKLPATVQALLAARIGQLAPAERSLLERASVEGRTFHRGAVENLLRKAERAQIGSVLMALVRKQFISPSQPEFAGEDAFRFTHVLIREAAYESLPKQVRAELHEQIAAWLDQKPQSEDEIVGYHLEQAIGRRLRDVRRRSLAREREEEREPEVIELGPGGDAPESIGGLVVPFEPELEQMRRGLVLALRDYVGKNGFGDVVLGLSGGIDSALVAALAVDALGPEHVHCVSMPSRYSSEGTRSDARRLAENLGCDFREIAIEDIVTAFHAALGGLDGLAAENVQARIRGTMLMALSNTHGWLVLATGNKSELSVGYSTLYGDLPGGFALIKDVYKTDVFRLVLHLNERADRELVPASIIERAPSAELRDEQLDSDSLPPYPELDPVLEAYVELDRSRDELVAEGFDAGVVDRALALIDRAEYKRRQAPPGVKLRPKAFGRDRRTPITNRWQG